MINLGDKARDSVSGFEGTVIARTEWLYGCVRYALQPNKLKDGLPIEERWFDQAALQLVQETEQPVAKVAGGRVVGGPQRDPKR